MNSKEELVKDLKKYSLLNRVVLSLDAILAILILIFSNKLLKTEFGKVSLIFGFIMLVVVTLLGILRKLSSK